MTCCQHTDRFSSAAHTRGHTEGSLTRKKEKDSVCHVTRWPPGGGLLVVSPRLTHGEVGGVDAVALRFVEHQRGRAAAVVRAHRVDTGSAHTALLLALVMICGERAGETLVIQLSIFNGLISLNWYNCPSFARHTVAAVIMQNLFASIKTGS